jgi:hypothetical protein
MISHFNKRKRRIKADMAGCRPHTLWKCPKEFLVIYYFSLGVTARCFSVNT